MSKGEILMDPIVLNVADVLRAALAKWDQLGANTGKATCRYRYEDGTCCVIGAALDDETVARFGRPGISSFIDRGLVCTNSEQDLISLQRSHDAACCPASRYHNEQRREFAGFVKGLAAKYGVEIPEGLTL